MIKQKDKTRIWEDLTKSGKFPYSIALRSLENILDAGVDEKHVIDIASMIASPEQVHRSKELPFEFLSAYKEIMENESDMTPILLNSLECAIKESAQNIRGFDINQSIVIACDISGSMKNPIAEKSNIQHFEIGLLLGMVLRYRCKSVVSAIFGDTFKIIEMPNESIIENTIELHHREGEVGYSTNSSLVIQNLIEKKIEADKVMIFTDCQMWNSDIGWEEGSRNLQDSWNEYKRIYPHSKLYLFDLTGYSDSPVAIPQKDVYVITGWSDKVFDYLEELDNGSSSVVHVEENVI